MQRLWTLICQTDIIDECCLSQDQTAILAPACTFCQEEMISPALLLTHWIYSFSVRQIVRGSPPSNDADICLAGP
jgi:hypothetical protein